MKRRVATAVALTAAGAAVALAVPTPETTGPDATQIVTEPARGELEPPSGDPVVVELLSGIDFIPPRVALDDALGANAEATLISIATDGTPIADPGVRIRALRALAMYDSLAVETALIDAVGDLGDGIAPLDNLYLRAAMDSLAAVAGPAAVDHIKLHLHHASRDVRAAAARAMGATGSAAAPDLLRGRLAIEPEEQVKVAISKAIRELEGD